MTSTTYSVPRLRFILSLAFGLWMGLWSGMEVQAQPFADVTSAAIPGITDVYAGDVVWADFNRDGRLDLALSGTNSFNVPVTRVYLQNASGQFSSITNLPATALASMAVGDFNNDGYPDLVIVGSISGTGSSRVYLYQPGSGFQFNNNFTINLSSSGVTNGAVAVADYDGDGDADLAIAGQNGGTRILRLFRNDGGTGLLLDTTLTGVAQPYLSFGDYDGDGDQDLLYTGTNASSQGITRLVQNLGNSFLLTTPSLPNVRQGGANWADYDHDGDLDVVIWGIDQASSNAIAEVYRNDSLLGFVPIGAGLTAISQGEIIWGDYNNDGWYDLVEAGNRNGNLAQRITELHLNDQTGDFNKDASNSNVLANANQGARLALGDYNNDGQLDLFVSGYDQLILIDAPISNLYVNNGTAGGLSPPTPQNLQANSFGSVVELSWELPPGFPANLKPGLSYQVAIGSTSGGIDILSPLSNLNTGQRRTTGLGAESGTRRLIRDLPPGTYFWTVQSVGANFQGSGFFGTPQSFTVTAGGAGSASFTDATTAGFDPNPLDVPDGLENASLTWGDIDQDGDLDFLATGLLASSPTTLRTYLFENKIIASTGAGFGFAEVTTSLPAVQLGDVKFADFDQDNDLDLAMVGLSSSGGIARVYENLGGGNFASTPITLPGVSTNFSQASLDWGDYDGDGDQDLIITGLRSGSAATVLYRNNFIGNNTKTFTEVSGAFPNQTGFSNGDVIFADFDRDGDLDVVLSGSPNANMGAGNQPLTRIYLNDGSANFGQAPNSIIQLKPATSSSLAVADLNNDQWLDVVVMGYLQSNFTQPVVSVHRNLMGGGGGFTEVPLSPPITGVANGSIDVGDYDDDGWPDLLITGNGSGGAVSVIYRNLSNPLAGIDFEEDNPSTTTLLPLSTGSQARWADVNNDQKLDLLMVGRNGGTRQFKLYRNTDGNPNVTPNPPGNLSTDVVGFEVQLSWDAPANIAPSLRDGLYYNLYLRRVGSTTLLETPEAEVGAVANNGFRRVVGPGNQAQELTFSIDDLTPGDYEWTVQAIDQDWEGSDFAAMQTFTFEDPSFLDVSASALEPSTLLKMREASLAFADYDNDGNLDFAVMGQTSAGADTVALYKYDATAAAYAGDAANSQFLTPVANGDLAWGDLNQDNRPDLAVMGENTNGAFARVHLNFLGGFSGQPNLVVELNGGQGLRNGALAWGDYDNDGWMDLVVMGEDAGGNPTVVFHRNNRQDSLIPQGNLGVVNLADGDLAWGDVNQDGWLDLAISGADGAGAAQSRLYLNDQQGGFTPITITALPNLRNSTLAWGDYNADGRLDLALSGRNGSQVIGRVLRNTGDFSGNTGLVDANAPVTGAEGGTVTWGDYDSDGFQDLLVVGQDGITGSELSVHLYRYDNSLGQFVDEAVQAAPLIPLGDQSDVAWGDYNSDGKLDLLMVGKSGIGSTQNTLSLIRNINPNPTNTPGAPTNPIHTIDGYEVILNWNAPSVSNAAGLSYNVLLDFAPISGNLRRSPLAYTTTGKRKVVARGQVNDTTQFRFFNLPAGDYQWRVQAIDGDYQGSPFSTEGSFTYAPPSFLDSTVEVFGGTLPTGLSDGDLAWIDYDRDGDLDLLVTGDDGSKAVSGVYRNDGGTFTFLTLGLNGLKRSSLDVADFDGDQRPDLAILGEDNTGARHTYLYRNTGSSFTLLTSSLPGLFEGDLAFGDYDNDGDADLVISGNDGTGPRTELWANDGSGTFTLANSTNLQAVEKGHLSWQDFNLDQLPDLLVMGENSGSPILRLYRNEGDGLFSEVSRPPASGLIGLGNSAADWADFNNDGYPDLAITGRNQTQLQTRIIRNNGGTSFSNVINLPSVENGDIRWGDYDDDGRVELVYVGESSSGPMARLYRQESGSFQVQSIAQLPLRALEQGNLAWGDYNGDGKLDLALMGQTGTQRYLHLYRNVDSTLNLAPTAPTGLSAQIEADTLIFSWDRPANSLGQSFNLYVGTAANQADVLPGLADLNTGLRRVVSWGNAGTDTSLRLIGLPTGNFSWGVQTIDRDFEASAWTAGSPLAYERPDFINYTPRFFGAAPRGYRQGMLAWADYDRDGDLDLLVSGGTEAGVADTRLYRQNNSGQLVSQQVLDDLVHSAAAWADLDGDEDLDLVIMGESPNSGEANTQIYRNTGNSLTLDNARSATLPDLTRGALAWIDANNDGAPDLIITGTTGSTRQGALYLNDGNGFFSPDPLTSLPGLTQASLSVGDYDRDGDQDFALSGQGTVPFTAVYRNQGVRGGFRTLTSNLPQLRGGSVAWGDATGNGRLDLLVSGTNVNGGLVTSLLIFDPNTRTFANRPEAQLQPAVAGHAAWADFDDDGLADLAISGADAAGNPVARLYRNVGGNSLALESTTSDALLPLRQAYLAWGDVDHDGKIDLAHLGEHADGSPRLYVYRNQNAAPNQVPPVLTNLGHDISADSVILSWDEPSSTESYTYNLRVGTTPGNWNVVAPAAANDGYRQLASRGKAGARPAYRLMGLDSAWYYWQVQTVGPDLEGGAFSTELDSFLYIPPHFIDVSSLYFDASASAYQTASVAYGDYDADGDLDLAVAGIPSGGGSKLELYENQGGRRLLPLTSISDSLEGLQDAHLSWRDVNQDGFPDLLAIGLSGSRASTQLYLSDGDTFRALADAGLPDLQEASADWGDFNHDGQEDLLLAGLDAGGNRVAGLWLNTGGSPLFQASGQSLAALAPAQVRWVDFDRDGYLDVLITGNNGSNAPELQAYRNDTRGNLQPLSGVLSGNPDLLLAPELDVADFNADGYPDFVVSGDLSAGPPLTQVFVHNGSEEAPFWDLYTPPTALPQLSGGQVAWGDYNDDGRSDLLLTGADAANIPGSFVLAQTANGDFVNDNRATNFLTTLATGGGAAWADVDLDGKLDLTLAGNQPTAGLRLFRNDEPTPNRVAPRPGEVEVQIVGSAVRVLWQAPTDYPANLLSGLTYQLSIREEGQNGYFLSPQAMDSVGTRYIVAAGGSGAVRSWLIEGLEVGKTYQIEVQSIEPDFEGSAFSSFRLDFTPPAYEWANADVFRAGVPAAITNATTAVADYDGDGDLDLVVAGRLNGTPVTRLYRNNNGRLQEDTRSVIPQLAEAGLAWGDFNLDDRPDLLIVGRRQDVTLDAALLINQGDGTLLVDNLGSGAFEAVDKASIAWADYNGDGYPDVAIAGQLDSGEPLTQLYRNQGGESFTLDETASNSLADVKEAFLAWADFDGNTVPNDQFQATRRGKPDLLLLGTNEANNPVSIIYRNRGNGTFGAVASGITQVTRGSGAWGLINNDEYPDLVISGLSNGVPTLSVYTYSPTDFEFVEQNTGLSLLDIYDGTVQLGDYDSDGKADLLVAGATVVGSNAPEVQVYRNRDGANFELDLITSSDLDSAAMRRAIWADFNNDGQLDIFSPDALDYSTGSGRGFGLFRNIDTAAFVPAQPPRNLRSRVFGNEVTFEWETPDPDQDLTFNLYLQREGDDRLAVETMAESASGFRREVELGNLSFTQSSRRRDLPDGKYYWSVQSVDAALQGGPFAPLDSFVYNNPVPVIIDSLFPPLYRDGTPSVLSYIELETDTMVDEVIVHHKFIADSAWQTTVVSGSGGRYEFNIGLELVDEMGVEYYYEVVGLYGYDARTDTHYTYRFYDQGLDVRDLRNGRVATAYNIISVPLQLEDSLISNVIVPDFGRYNPRQYRIFQYRDGAHAEFNEGADWLTPGEGTWIITRRARQFNSGPGRVVPANDAQPFQWQLQPGWNQVGNPYPYALTWSDVVRANPTVIDSVEDFLAFNNGYEAANLIDAFRGGFIFANATVTLDIPVRKNPSVNRLSRLRDLSAGPLDADFWRVPLRVNQGEWQQSIAAVGMHPEAKEGYDHWDASVPPRLREYLELRFEEEKHPRGALSQDLVAPQEEYVWEFEVATNLDEREVRLSWDTNAFGQSSKRLVLFDVAEQTAIDMGETEEYRSYADSESRRFRLYYGDAAFIQQALQPDRVHLGQAYPNPTQGSVIIPFALPPGSGYEVQLSVVDMQGRVLYQGEKNRFDSGFQAMKWDGRDQRGQSPPPGLYLYRLKIQQGGENWQQSRRLLIE